MGCCESKKGQDIKAASSSEQLISESTITHKVLENLLDKLEENHFDHSPSIEALSLYFSKLYFIIYKEFYEPFKLKGLLDKSKNVKGLRCLRENLEAFSSDLTQIFEAVSKEENPKEKLQQELEKRSIKINQFSGFLSDISQKSLNIYFANYAEAAKGIGSFDFVNGYEKILSRIEKIERDLDRKIEGFSTNIGAQFWEMNYKQKNEADFEDFKKKLTLFSEQMNKYSLNEEDFEKIRGEVCGESGEVLKKKWDEFYAKKFCEWRKRKALGILG